MSKKAIYRVGQNDFVSLCATCEFMPSGKVPQGNQEVLNNVKPKPHAYCTKKAFFPDINFDNQGKPFYDVANCDGFVEYRKTEQHGNGQPIRPDESAESGTTEGVNP